MEGAQGGGGFHRTVSYRLLVALSLGELQTEEGGCRVVGKELCGKGAFSLIEGFQPDGGLSVEQGRKRLVGLRIPGLSEELQGFLAMA